jgi:hypothetical protein
MTDISVNSLAKKPLIASAARHNLRPCRLAPPKNLSPGIDRVGLKLDYLANLSGLTSFERDFIAQLRAADQIPIRQLRVLAKIWQRHNRPRWRGPTLKPPPT